jgi:outer membrane autotransporter protein
MAVTPSIEAAWVHEHLDRESRLTAGFAEAPAATFDIRGPRLDRNRARVGAGVTAQLTDRSSLNVSYQGEVADSDDHHTFGATYRMNW